MTRSEAARRFWARHDREQAARDAQNERYIIARASDCTEHVAVWEAFNGLARLIGHDRALQRWAER